MARQRKSRELTEKEEVLFRKVVSRITPSNPMLCSTHSLTIRDAKKYCGEHSLHVDAALRGKTLYCMSGSPCAHAYHAEPWKSPYVV